MRTAYQAISIHDKDQVELRVDKFGGRYVVVLGEFGQTLHLNFESDKGLKMFAAKVMEGVDN
jgi:hypothetical protein